MTKKVSLHKWQFVLGLLLSWIGLSGIADGLVEWKEWFETGWMVHWRAFKDWIILDLLFWLPFKVPDYLVDYAALGAVTSRSVIGGYDKYKLDHANKRARAIDMRHRASNNATAESPVDPTISLDGKPKSIASVGLIAVTFLFWPYVLFIAFAGLFPGFIRSIRLPVKVGVFRARSGSYWAVTFFSFIFAARIASRSIVPLFLISVTSFVIFLFVASDIIYSLGFANRP